MFSIPLHIPIGQRRSFPFYFRCLPLTTNDPSKHLDYFPLYFLSWHLSSSPTDISFWSGRSPIMSSLSNLMGFLSPHLLGFFLALDSDVHPCPYGNVLSLGSWAILMFCLSLMLLGPILPVWLQFSYFPFSYMRVCLTLCLYPSFLLFFQQLFVTHIHLFQRCTEEWAMDLWVALIYFTGQEIVVWPLVHNSFRRWSCISEISIILHYRS